MRFKLDNQMANLIELAKKIGADYIKPVIGYKVQTIASGGKMTWEKSELFKGEENLQDNRWLSIVKGDYYLVVSSDYKGDYEKESFCTMQDILDMASKYIEPKQEPKQEEKTQQEPIGYVMFGRFYQTWDDVYMSDDFDGYSHKPCYSLQDVARFVGNYQDSLENGYVEGFE